MFLDNEKIRPAATPERVLAICRLVGYQKYTKEEINQLCALDKGAKMNDESRRNSFMAAEELGLIELVNGKYILKISEKDLENPVTFRRAISPIIFSRINTTFFKFTEWFILNSEVIYSLNKFEDIAAMAAKSGIDEISENAVLGIRFWLYYLGHAYQYNNTIIPNMKVRLEDALRVIPKGTVMTNIEFVDWLKANIPEARAACTYEKLPLAVSNGLRILNNENKIELQQRMDAVKTELYPIASEKINDFWKIEIKEITDGLA